jgi:hypothetical protein
MRRTITQPGPGTYTTRRDVTSAVLVHLKGRALAFQVLIQSSSAVVSSSSEQNTPRSRQRRCSSANHRDLANPGGVDRGESAAGRGDEPAAITGPRAPCARTGCRRYVDGQGPARSAGRVSARKSRKSTARCWADRQPITLPVAVWAVLSVGAANNGNASASQCAKHPRARCRNHIE